jgi:hypothetical protein
VPGNIRKYPVREERRRAAGPEQRLVTLLIGGLDNRDPVQDAGDKLTVALPAGVYYGATRIDVAGRGVATCSGLLVDPS